MMDSDLPKKPAYHVGQDISALSVDELSEMIVRLRDEIERLEQERKAKDTTKSAAEDLFKPR